jgi:hypothetical protein
MTNNTQAPGRDLDVLVATKVMGWVRLDDGVDPHTSEPFERWRRSDGSKYSGIPSYSTSIEAAWEVVEKLHLSLVWNDEGWEVYTEDQVVDHELEHGGFAARERSAPHAICLAALKAVGVLK